METISSSSLEGFPNLLPLRKPILLGRYVLTHVSVCSQENGGIRIVAYSRILDTDLYQTLSSERKAEVVSLPQITSLKEFNEMIQKELELVFFTMKGNMFKTVK